MLAESITDPARFAELYERHLRSVATYLARRVGSGPAEDLTAEVFARAFRSRARYRADHESALPWLLGIASHLVADHRRAERRRLDVLERVLSSSPQSLESEVAVLAPVLVAQLRNLSAADRDALLLVVWGELSYEEAAAALRVPIGTIRSRISRARRRLSEELARGAPGLAAVPATASAADAAMSTEGEIDA